MSSRRNEITAAVLAEAFAAAAAVHPKIRAFRARVTPIERSTRAAIVARQTTDGPAAKVGSTLQRTVRVAITIIAWGDTGEQVDAVTDPIAVAVHAAIFRDQSLAGLAIGVTDEGATWAYEDADGGIAGEITTVYGITYRAPTDALT